MVQADSFEIPNKSPIVRKDEPCAYLYKVLAICLSTIVGLGIRFVDVFSSTGRNLSRRKSNICPLTRSFFLNSLSDHSWYPLFHHPWSRSMFASLLFLTLFALKFSKTEATMGTNSLSVSCNLLAVLCLEISRKWSTDSWKSCLRLRKDNIFRIKWEDLCRYTWLVSRTLASAVIGFTVLKRESDSSYVI